MQGLGSWAFIFAPILIVPQVSPDYWGPMVGYYYLIPVAALLTFGPIALLLLIILSMSQWIMVIVLTITDWAKPELEIDTIESFKSNAAQYERYLGLIIVTYIAMYFYYLMIAWCTGLEIANPKEALNYAVEFINPHGDDY
jgi:hypothetical protein